MHSFPFLFQVVPFMSMNARQWAVRMYIVSTWGQVPSYPRTVHDMIMTLIQGRQQGCSLTEGSHSTQSLLQVSLPSTVESPVELAFTVPACPFVLIFRFKFKKPQCNHLLMSFFHWPCICAIPMYWRVISLVRIVKVRSLL